MEQQTKKEARKLAEEHVDWFLTMLRPLLISFMIHGIKHGQKDGTENKTKGGK